MGVAVGKPGVCSPGSLWFRLFWRSVEQRPMGWLGTKKGVRALMADNKGKM